MRTLPKLVQAWPGKWQERFREVIAAECPGPGHDSHEAAKETAEQVCRREFFIEEMRASGARIVAISKKRRERYQRVRPLTHADATERE